MATVIVDVRDLPGRLQELITLSQDGTEVVLREGESRATLSASNGSSAKLETNHSVRTPGLSAGMIWMAQDFDDPLPDSFWDGPVSDPLINGKP